MKKAKEMRELSDEQLENLVYDLSREIYELKNELATTHKLEQPHLIKEKKHEKARALTILCERKGATDEK